MLDHKPATTPQQPDHQQWFDDLCTRSFEKIVPPRAASHPQLSEVTRDVLSLYAIMTRAAGLASEPPTVHLYGTGSMYLPFHGAIVIGEADVRRADAYAEEAAHAIRHQTVTGGSAIDPRHQVVNEFFGYLGRQFVRELGGAERLAHLDWTPYTAYCTFDTAQQHEILMALNEQTLSLAKLVQEFELGLVVPLRTACTELEQAPVDARREVLERCLPEISIRFHTHITALAEHNLPNSAATLQSLHKLFPFLTEQLAVPPELMGGFRVEAAALQSFKVAAQMLELQRVATCMEAYQGSQSFHLLQSTGHLIGYPAAAKAIRGGTKPSEIFTNFISASDDEVYAKWIS
jgi:hypothetical protein